MMMLTIIITIMIFVNIMFIVMILILLMFIMRSNIMMFFVIFLVMMLIIISITLMVIILFIIMMLIFVYFHHVYYYDVYYYDVYQIYFPLTMFLCYNCWPACYIDYCGYRSYSGYIYSYIERLEEVGHSQLMETAIPWTACLVLSYCSYRDCRGYHGCCGYRGYSGYRHWGFAATLLVRSSCWWWQIWWNDCNRIFDHKKALVLVSQKSYLSIIIDN